MWFAQLPWLFHYLQNHVIIPCNYVHVSHLLGPISMLLYTISSHLIVSILNWVILIQVKIKALHIQATIIIMIKMKKL